MRKMRKILILVLIAIASIITTTTNVYAFAVGDRFNSFSNRSGGSSSMYFKRADGSTYGYSKVIYTAVYSKDNTRYDVFCMDPGRATPANLYVKRVFLTEKSLAKKDFGLATIITTQPGDGEFQTSGDSFVVAKGIALRVFLDGYCDWSSSQSNKANVQCLKDTSNYWLTGSGRMGLGSGSDDAVIINDAKKLFDIGVKASKGYSEQSVPTVEKEIVDVTDANVSEEELQESTNQGANTSTGRRTFTFGQTGSNTTGEESTITATQEYEEINKKQIIKINLKNFDKEKGEFKFDKFESTANSNVTITVKGISDVYSTKFEDYTTPLTFGENILAKYKDKIGPENENENGTINFSVYVAIETTGQVELPEINEEKVSSCEKICEDYKAKLYYTLKDPKALTGAVLYDNNTGVSGAQRFLVAAKTQNESSDAIEIPIDACADCIVDECSPVLCKGDDCEYNQTLPQLCEDGAKVDKEGYVEYKFLEAYTENGYNIVKCINKAGKDVAGNPYKLEDSENAKVVVDNPYCSILCKEDYSIKVPYKVPTEEGRYFSIGLKMNGQQDCYSTEFDTKKFEKDVEEKTKEIITAINKWNIYYELVNKDINTLDYSDNETESCTRLEGNPVAIGGSFPCSRDTVDPDPSTDRDDTWYVRIGKMRFGQNADVTYYKYDEDNKKVVTKPKPDDSEIPDNVTNYGKIDEQTINKSNTKSILVDGNTKRNVNTYYTGTLSDGASVKIKVNASGVISWEVDNTGNERSTSGKFMVRGYDSNGFVSQYILRVSAPADREGSDPTNSGTENLAGSGIKQFTVEGGNLIDNDSCNNQQDVCKKTEAPQDLEKRQKEEFEKELDNAKGEVETKIEELKEIIDQYNSCVGDKEYQALSPNYEGSSYWKMIYKYNPQIKYSYDEPDPTNTSRSKWIKEVQKLVCDGKTCDIMYSKNEMVTAEDCAEGDEKCTSVGADGKVHSIFNVVTSNTSSSNSSNTAVGGGSNSDNSISPQNVDRVGDNTGLWWPIGGSEVVGGIFYPGTPVKTEIGFRGGCEPRNSDTQGSQNHLAIDIPGDIGITPVIAIADGKVLAANENITIKGKNFSYGYWGEYVLIQHTNGMIAMYAHMASGSVQVKSGDDVKQGQLLGKVGQTGIAGKQKMVYDCQQRIKATGSTNYSSCNYDPGNIPNYMTEIDGREVYPHLHFHMWPANQTTLINDNRICAQNAGISASNPRPGLIQQTAQDTGSNTEQPVYTPPQSNPSQGGGTTGNSSTEADIYVNTYCTDKVFDDYSCNGGETLNKLGESSYDKKPFFLCEYDETSKKFDCKDTEEPVTKVKFLHKAAVSEGDYETRRVYYSGHDDGDIKISYTERPILNYTQVPGLPVGADTPQGTYIYILNIENIGTFYNSGALGRIYGSDSKSLSTYVRNLQDKTTETFSVTTGIGANATDIKKEIAINEYACTYTVSESTCTDSSGKLHTYDECEIGGKHANWEECKQDLCPMSPMSSGSYCVKEAEAYYVCPAPMYDKNSCKKMTSREAAKNEATYNYNCCPECQVVCVGRCLYVVSNDKQNDGTLQYDFRTVSPANMNPNSRKLGYNWDTANASNSLAAQKASNTIAEIEARAGSANASNQVNVEEIAEYTLKVTMTPDMVTWIKEYNNSQASQGAYNNKSLTCYSYELDGYSESSCNSSGFIWQGDTCIMSNVFCYSEFIDQLEGKFPNQVDAPHRSEAKNSAHDNFRTYTGLSSQGQQIITNDYWTIYKYDNLDINGDGQADIGPSWK